MAEYYIAPKSSFDATADAIREKTGSQATIEWTEDGFADAIDAIPTGGGDANAILDGSLSGTYQNNNVTSLRYGAFWGTAIQHVILPNVTRTGGAIFRACSNLQSISANKCTKIDTYFAYYDRAITLVSLPLVNDVDFDSFNDCTALQIADFKGGIIRANSLKNCSSLSTLILRNTTVPNLTTTGAFTGSSLDNGGNGCTIYIPKVLYDHLGDGSSSDYRNQTNWATVYGYGTITFAKIEGSIYETHYADGTPIS